MSLYCVINKKSKYHSYIQKWYGIFMLIYNYILEILSYIQV